MRRLLLFRSELLPLSETFIAAQARALRRYEPWFAGLKRVPGGLALDERRVTVAAQGNSLGQKLARRVYLQTGFAPEFLRRIETLGPELIHAHFALDACAALAIEQRLRVPLLVTLHGYDVTSEDEVLCASSAGRVYLARREALWERAQVFVCVSEWIRQKALERGFPEEKLWVHPIGIDTELFRPDAARVKAPLVLFVGRLVEKKGCVHLLHAMRAVEDRLPEARLVVVGDGPLRRDLEAEARATLRRCEFAGALPVDAVREWMRRAAVVAVPSVVAANGDAEGLCLVVCEAQAMGIPVVGFRAPGIEVVDRETGLLAEQRDEASLADALLTLLGDRELAARMGAAGRVRVERLFDLRRQTELLEEKYDAVLQSACARERGR
ncbi:MAG TPA: glycosyltransferase [Acidobacteriaceae bacterium]|nr:glycosyltransferase [Acidobacteriaceae bacterium]